MYTLWVCSFSAHILTERLKKVISEEDVATIARKYLTDWESLRPYLGLSHQQEVEIRRSFQDYGRQKNECLQKWKEAKGNDATYGALITAAGKAENKWLADGVKTVNSKSCLHLDPKI